MKVIFIGSGPFGLPALERLYSRVVDIDIVCVVTRPNRRARRGGRPVAQPVRTRARAIGLPCEAPETANDPEFVAKLQVLEPDLIVVADYGEFLRKPIREVARIGMYNLHASLLPRYRGAAPVARALLAGEEVTGVTLFRVVKEMDAGPIVDRYELRVEPLESAGELEERLGACAGYVLDRNLDKLCVGKHQETPQDDSLATLAPKLEKSEGTIDWDTDPQQVTRRVLAMNPWPTAFSFLEVPGEKPERTSFLRVRPTEDSPQTGGELLPPGSVDHVRKDGFTIRCRGGSVEVLELRRAGRKKLDAAAYLQGRSLRVGDRFSAGPGPGTARQR